MKGLTGNTKSIIKGIKNYALISVASVIYAVAISVFLNPNDIAPGGITGVAILISRFTNIPVGTLNLILNIPIVLLGLWKFGFRFIISTLYALGLITVLTNQLSSYGAITDDLLIASVLGGCLLAVSLAMIFKAGATSGGIDIVIKILRLRWQHIKTNVFFLIMDAMVILASWIVFRDMTVAFYGGVAVVVNSVVMDYWLYGGDEAKLIYIISMHPEKIKQRIMNELDITATVIQGKGAYSGHEREVLMVVMRKQMASRTEEIVKEEDRNAFMIVSSASEIFGEGYKDIMRDKL